MLGVRARCPTSHCIWYAGGKSPREFVRKRVQIEPGPSGFPYSAVLECQLASNTNWPLVVQPRSRPTSSRCAAFDWHQTARAFNEAYKFPPVSRGTLKFQSHPATPLKRRQPPSICDATPGSHGSPVDTHQLLARSAEANTNRVLRTFEATSTGK